MGFLLAVVASSSNPNQKYRIEMSEQENVSCSCMHWRNQRLPIQHRTCKHIKSAAATILAKKAEGAISKSQAGATLGASKTQNAARIRAHNYYKAMSNGGESAIEAAHAVMADPMMPMTLRKIAATIIASK